MIINHNMNAMNAHRNMGINVNNAGKAMEKLSSGLRINRAGDDAAGLAISEKMRGQIRGLDQASRNAQDGVSMIQTAEGALNESQNILQRMRELAVQAGNDTNTTDDRTRIQEEINQLTEEVDRIANNTEFNSQKLLNGNKSGAAQAAFSDTFTALTTTAAQTVTINGTAFTVAAGSTADVVNAELTAKLEAAGYEVANGVVSKEGKDGVVHLQVGANSDQKMEVEISNMTSDSLSITTAGKAEGSRGLDVTSHTAAEAAITAFDDAINRVSVERSKLGAIQNRLEYTTKNLDNTSENLQSAESRIRDVDMAKEMLNFSKNNILQQAAQSMVSQAKQQPEGVLQLLR